MSHELAVDFSNPLDTTPQYLKDIAAVLGKGQRKGITKDSDKPLTHSTSDIQEVCDLTWDHIKSQKAVAAASSGNQSYMSLDEARKAVTLDIQKLTKDGFFNPMTNIGTSNDPGMQNTANIPISISPYEATALLASGGLPEIIINKKSKGILLNGYNLETKDVFWNVERISAIKERATVTNFESYLANGSHQGFVYGGSVLYPVFKRDSAMSFDYTIKELKAQGLLHKHCIAYWVVADRWNTTFVPNFNIGAQDYLFAKQYYVPMAGVSVKTERSAVIRPKQLPYWGAIQQLGWGISDFEGYMRSIFGYQIMIASIPIMAQQMSLLMYEIPIDGLIAQSGIEQVKEYLKLNDEQMRAWSMANPKTINALGKIYTVNRTYTGYSDLAVTMRQDIAAQSGLDEALLFHTQAKGFTSDTEEALLKQSETIRLSQKQITPSLQNIKDILIYDTFGIDSEEAKHKDTLQFSFDNPAIATESDRAESAARFAATVNSLKQANVPAAEALKLAKEFFKGITISDEVIAAIKERDETRFNTEVEATKASTEASKASAKEPKDSDKETKAPDKPASKEKDNAKETT